MLRQTLRKVKMIIKCTLGEDFIPSLQHRCNTERLGSDYGGWSICPNNVKQDSVIYSFGVGEDISFDIELIERFGVVIHAFDPTPRSIAWVRKQQLPENFVMHEYGIADFDGEVLFNPPENPKHISHTLLDRPSTQNRAIKVPVRKLSSIMSSLGHQEIDILKMDIEGAEYQVIEDIYRSNIRPFQILLEFHHGFPNLGLTKTKEAIARLNEMGYRLFSVSASGKECGFMRISS